MAQASSNPPWMVTRRSSGDPAGAPSVVTIASQAIASPPSKLGTDARLSQLAKDVLLTLKCASDPSLWKLFGVDEAMSNNADNADVYLTDEHLQWLVDKRSANQKSSYALHVILKDNYDKINGNADVRFVMSELISINFSLWRAVFLSDLSEGTGSMLKHAQSFLKNLVANNAVAYPQDRNAKEWTFTYYMHNAQYRLEYIVKTSPKILSNKEFVNPSTSDDKTWWHDCQTSLERAISNFEKSLN